MRPTAFFEVSKEKPEGLNAWNVMFDATDSKDDSHIDKYLWDFGDGSAKLTKTDHSASHKYLVASGDFTVTLTVVDDDGLTSEPYYDRIALAPNHAPTAAFTWTMKGTIPNVIIHFDASASSDPDPQDKDFLAYHWTFGDGTTAEAQGNPIIEHKYETAGEYLVSLVVDDKPSRNTTFKESTKVYDVVEIQ